MVSFFGLQRSIKVGCRSAAINEEIGSRDKRSPVTHQQLGYVSNLVRRTGTPCRTLGEHILVKIASRPVELIQCQRGYDNPRRDGVDTGIRSFSLTRIF